MSDPKYLALIIGLSTLISFGYILAAMLSDRVKTDADYWKHAIFASCSIPLCAVVIASLLPQSFNQNVSDYISHGFEEALNPALITLVGETSNNGLSLSALFANIMVIYLAISNFLLLRLTFARIQLWRIACEARPLYFSDKINVGITKRLGSACAINIGVLNKRELILIPEAYFKTFTPHEIDMIVKHEQCHLDKGDDRCGMILRILRALFWANPILHVIFRNWSEYSEIACDARVLARASRHDRKVYANIFAKALHLAADRVRQYPAASFSTRNLRKEKMRIAKIMSPPHHSDKSQRPQYFLSLGLSLLFFPLSMFSANIAFADSDKQQAVPHALSHIVEGRLTSTFGNARDPFNEGKTRMHKGVDIAAPIGTPIKAPAEGVIIEATDNFQNKPNYGKVVHLRLMTGEDIYFTHLDGYAVIVGQNVSAGQTIAFVGSSGKSTGPHVHIESHTETGLKDPITILGKS